MRCTDGAQPTFQFSSEALKMLQTFISINFEVEVEVKYKHLGL